MLEKSFSCRIHPTHKSTHTVFSIVFTALWDTIQYRFQVLKQIHTSLFILIILILSTIYSPFCLAQDPFLAGGTRPTTPKSSKSYLRNSEFYIPYQLNKESDAQNSLNLYVSRDGGQVWELYKSLIPAQETTNGTRQFNIRVGADGEYWFAFRPSRVENSPNPNLGNAPDVKIVVDTVPPVLKIESQRTSNDSITIFWTLADSNPDTSTVRFYQRFSNTTDWATIPIDLSTIVPYDNSDGTAGATGQFTVQIPAGTTELFLKGEATDKAKIPTIVLWNIPTAGSAANLPGTDRQTVMGMDGSNNSNYESVLSTPAPQTEPESKSETLETVTTPDTIPNPNVSDSPQQTSTDNQWSPLRNNPSNMGTLATEGTEKLPSTQSTTIVNKPSVVSPAQINYAKTMIVNTAQFDLDYEITSVGRSGVGVVELWAIRSDNKATLNGITDSWFLLATDKDTITPIPVELKEDGVYGIKLVIKNGAGLGGKSPIQGEKPTQWIVLDRTPPTGELKSAGIRIDSKIPQMLLRWESYDEFPSKTQVTLLWSRDGQEPWNPIANELPAVGEFLWTMPNDIPPRIIIKMEMIDMAGNKNEFVSRPVAADIFSPQGFIRNIHPQDQ